MSEMGPHDRDSAALAKASHLFTALVDMAPLVELHNVA